MPIFRASPGLVVVRRSSDSAARNSGNTGTTLTDDDQLRFAIGANEVWWIQAFLLANAASTAIDFKYGWSVPVGATMTWGDFTATVWVSGGVGVNPSALVGAGTALSRGTLAGTSGVAAAGVVVNGATAGTVVLQWAQSTSDSGDLKVMANSLLILHRLG